MNAQLSPLRGPLWAALDALVLEEMDALDRPLRKVAEPQDFASDEDFLARTSVFLRGHPGAEGLVERLCGDLRLFHRDEPEMPATAEEAEGEAEAGAEIAPAAQPDAVP
jgi:hypothetical protein